MGVVELGSLVVRLVGNATSYLDMLSVAQTTTQAVVSVVGGATQKIQSFTTSLSGFASTALKAFGMLGVSGSLTGSFDKFVQFEMGALRLTAAIEASGRAAGPVIKDYGDFATALAAVTTQTKGSVMGLLQQAEAMGIQDEQAKAVVKNAVALAAAKGGEASSYMRVSIALSQGNIQMLRSTLGMRGVKDQSEVLAKAQQVLASGFKIAQAEALSSGGQIDKLKKSLGGLSTEVGGLIAGAIQPIVTWLVKAVDWFKSLDPAVKGATVAVITLFSVLTNFKSVVGILSPLLGLLSAVFSPIGIAVALTGIAIAAFAKNVGGLQPLWTLVKDAALDAWGKIKATVAAFLVWVKPLTDALTDLWDASWQAIRDGVMFTWQVIKTAFTNIKNFILDAWESLGGDKATIFDTLRDSAVGAVQIITQVVKNLGPILSTAFSGVQAITGVILSIGSSVLSVGQTAVNWVIEFVVANKSLLGTLTAVAVGVGVVVGVVKLVAFTIGTVQAVLAFLKVQQIASAILWGVWAGAVLLVKGIMLVFSGVMFTFNAILSGSAFATVAYWVALIGLAPVILAVKIATWLWNAALTVMNALLAPVAILAIAATIGVLAVAFAVVAGVVYGVVEAGDALWTSLGQLGSMDGPLGHISGLFKEWGGILGDVVRAAKIDMPLAWEILTAGATLAMSQIKDLWPPLWKFIQEGAAIIWPHMASQFEVAFSQAVVNVLGYLSGWVPGVEAMITEVNRKATEARTYGAETAQKQLAQLVQGFSVTESQATKDAREAVTDLQDDLDLEEWFASMRVKADILPKSLTDKAIKDALNVGSGIGDGMTKGFKSHDFNAVLFGSAEAMKRINEYKDRLEGKGLGSTGTSLGGVLSGGGGGAGGAFSPTVARTLAEGSSPRADPDRSQIIDLLTRIAGATEKTANKGTGTDLVPADIP